MPLEENRWPHYKSLCTDLKVMGKSAVSGLVGAQINLQSKESA